MNIHTTRLGSIVRTGVPAAALGLAMAFASGGCDSKTSTGGGGKTGGGAGGSTIAVVDFERLGNSVGWNSEIQKELEKNAQDYKLRVESFNHDVDAAVDEKKRQIARKVKNGVSVKQLEDAMKSDREFDKLGLSQDDKTDLVNSLRNAEQYKQAAVNDANKIVGQRRQQIASAYTEAVKPIVRRVAQANGFSLVATPSANFIWYDAGLDITDRVIDEVQKAKPDHPLPDAPKLNFPRVDVGAPPTTAPSATAPSTPR